jgi:hypothetical protein
MHKFDPYEYIGVIIPGIVVVITLILLYPATGYILNSGVSVGEFGLILIVSIVAGHLIQAFGNVFETVLWGLSGGMPTAWPANGDTKLLSQKQVDRLQAALKSDFECELLELKSGRGPIREVNAIVRQKGKVDRIETFNRNYGLMRGIATALLLASGLILLKDYHNWPLALGMVFASAVATFRMVRFGEHYAREMFVEYLRCRELEVPKK